MNEVKIENSNNSNVVVGNNSGTMSNTSGTPNTSVQKGIEHEIKDALLPEDRAGNLGKIIGIVLVISLIVLFIFIKYG